MRISQLVVAVLISCSVVFVARAQSTRVTGRYDGTAEIEGKGRLVISAELREAKGKVTGVVHTPLGDTPVLDGTFAAGVLTLTLDAGGDDLLLSGRVSVGGAIAGQVSGEVAKGTFTLTRVGDLPDATAVVPEIHQSKDKWREDLRFLASELPKRHKNAFNRISKSEWEALIRALDEQIPNLPDEDIVLGMSRIVSRIGDGHTGLGWGGLFPRLPVRLFWFKNELRVTQVSSKYPQLSGARVTKINGRDVSEVYQASRGYIAAGESEQYVLNSSPFLFTFPQFLKNAGLGSSEKSTEFEFLGREGRRNRVTVDSLASDADVRWLEAYKTQPHYLKNPELPFFFEYFKDARLVYVNFRWYPRRPEFRTFSKELFQFIDKNDVEKLVFDFRQNGGGDFTRGRDYFVKQVKERPHFLERGRLFAVIGRRTFSAGMANAADFRNDLKAILVGEPTGARPNGYQENRGFSLPNSHLEVSYSIELYKFSGTDTPGIIPDMLIEPKWESYVSGRDDALDWITAYHKSK
jgi:hypothetical protein